MQTASSRLLIGLLQGGLLYLLYRAYDGHAWPATVPQLFAPLSLVAMLAPILLVSGLGHMPRRSLLLWALGAAAVLAVLGWYDAWRIADLPLPQPQPKVYRPTQSVAPTAPLLLFSIAGLFIAHALVLAAARDGRPVARHATYFDVAWKLGVQLGFSLLFVGVTWLVLQLGAELFALIDLDFLRRLVKKSWFAIPVTTFAFACAMQLTDVRPAIVRGIRGLALTLMSWLLPVAVLLVAGFLCSLPFTGLSPLWATRHAASVLLLAAALFVGLINAAWQDGSEAAAPARPVRLGARVAALLLLPLVVLAMYALGLRVLDYGWTVERVQAAACMLIASCYALGYAWTASKRGWLPTLDRVNTATAFAILAVLVLVFSPLVDPARIAVHSQLARLESGRTSAQHFDFVFLRFDGARFGREALDRLDARAAQAGAADGAFVRQRIAAVRKLDNRWERPELGKGPAELAANLHVHPAGTVLPPALLQTDFSAMEQRWRVPDCLYVQGKACDAVLMDVTGDGKPEVIVLSADGRKNGVLGETAPGQWRLIASLDVSRCGPVRAALLAGQGRSVEATMHDIEAGGVRVHVDAIAPPAAARDCPAKD